MNTSSDSPSLTGSDDSDDSSEGESAGDTADRLAVAHYHEGLSLQRDGRDLDAIAAFRRATEQAPGMVDALARLGELLYARGASEEAQAVLRQATMAAPGSAIGRLAQGRILFHEGRLDEAEAFLIRAIGRDPRDGALHHLLGNVLRQAGRFGEAIACFERAVAADNRCPQSYYPWVASRRLTDSDRPLIARMRQALAADGLSEDDRVALRFALGKAHDDLGDYAEAIRHFDAGNRLQSRGCRLDRAQLAGFVDESIGGLTKDFISRSAAAGSRSERPVLIVGMPRSGTTLVEQILSRHPEIGAGDELLYWHRSIVALGRVPGRGLDPATTRRLAADYLSLLRGIAPGAKRVTDKMPYNFRYLGLILSVFPKARIIHCRRNPADTALSLYFTLFQNVTDFAYDRDDIVFYYEQYLRLMAHWRAVIRPDRILDVDYEQLVADRQGVARRMIAFCGLDWNDACLSHQDSRRVVKTASLWQVRQPIYQSSIARWRRYEPWLGAVRRLLGEQGA